MLDLMPTIQDKAALLISLDLDGQSPKENGGTKTNNTK